jgi:hypothetical protein
VKAISGYLAKKDHYGDGKEFALRTVSGKMRFSAPANIPPMREGDMITVVTWGDTICAISNLSTGAEFRYNVSRPHGPYRSEKITWITILGLNLGIGALPLIGFLLAKSTNDILASLLIPWAIAWAAVASFLWYRAIVTNHNVRISDEVQKAVQNSCGDLKAWALPEFDEEEL